MSATLWLSSAGALGLGDIDVNSKLNQRFSASIPVTSVEAEEAENLIVTLAGAEEFARAGIERTDFLYTLKFTLSTEGGKPRILVSSQQIAREPFIAFLLDVRAKSGRMLREYTILLDPPDSAPTPKPAAVVKPAPATDFYETPQEAAQRSAPPTVHAQPAQPVTPPATPVEVPAPAEPAAEPAPAAPAEATAAATTYGPVLEAETLWSVATKLRTDPAVTMDQVLLAIYTANPRAFEGGINGLRKGSMLDVPSPEAQRAVGAAAARSRVAELRGLPAPVRVPKAKPEPKPQPKAEAEPAPQVSAPPAAAEKKN